LRLLPAEIHHLALNLDCDGLMTTDRNNLDLAVIGNCTIGALVDKDAKIQWGCFPDFSGDPVFCSLLQNGVAADSLGFFEIELSGQIESEQRYIENTAVVVTTIRDGQGGAIEICDFAPRFKQMGRVFRPTAIVRQIKPVSGHPQVKFRLRPARNWGEASVETTRGSNHIRYVGSDVVLRCTTDIPVSYLLKEIPFVLEQPFSILLGPDETLNTPIAETVRDFFERTCEYWREWSRYLSIPLEWQEAVIRSAITLKLCSFEETGAVIAAMTTSIPESENSGRNWDYRFCWLRDGYFVVRALNRLGATKTMEGYLHYITNLVADSQGDRLQPVYGITYDKKLTEEIVETLSGYLDMGPVRRGNQAYEHIQNDVYGSVILAVTQTFFDNRLTQRGNGDVFRYLEPLGERCLELYDQTDAGLWELRGDAGIHTYSSVMCWAGADRLAKIAEHLGITERGGYWRQSADRMRQVILENAFNQERNSFVDTWGGDHLDGSLLLLLELGFIDADDPRFAGTVDAVGKELKRGNHVLRYVKEDDFGKPHNSFVICTFWYIDALVQLGRTDEAREMFEEMLRCRNHVGLLSEDIDPATGELWGNFPQTYSMVGLINSAMQLSKPWKDAF